MKPRVGVCLLNGHISEARLAHARRRIAGWSGRIAAFVLVGLVVVACSSSAASPTSAAGGGEASSAGPSTGPTTQASSAGQVGVTVSDPCSLLTQAEVSAALGVSVGAGDSASDSHACDWTYTPPNGLVPTAQASIVIDFGTPFSSLCGAPSNAALGITIVQVGGVGDGACYDEIQGLGTTMIFEKGGQAFSVSASLGAAPNTTVEADEKTLSLDAVARL